MTTHPGPPGLCRNIRDLIAQRGTTVTAVADAIGVPRSTLRGRLPGDSLLITDVTAIAKHFEPHDRDRMITLLIELFNDRQERHLSVV